MKRKVPSLSILKSYFYSKNSFFIPEMSSILSSGGLNRRIIRRMNSPLLEGFARGILMGNRRKKEVFYIIKRLFKTIFSLSEALVLLVGSFIRYLKFPLIAQINTEITTLAEWWEGRSSKICGQYSYMNFLPQAMASLWIFILLSATGCEIYSDALTKPEYVPSLAIHAILSPQEGGNVYIKYTRPVDSTNAQPVPLLPELAVFLYENNERKYTFTELEKGHFSLDTAGIAFLSNSDYHIEVEDKTGNSILKSGNDRLPSLPDVVATRFYQDTTTFPEKNYIYLKLNLTPGFESAYHYRKDYSIDSGRVFIPGRDAEYGRFSIRELVHTEDFSDGTVLETLRSSTFVKPYPGADNQYVSAVNLWVDHLSPGLTRFFQDVADYTDSYGDPFTTKNPVYSNIEGGYGIFGMYNSWVDVLFLEK